MKKLFSLALVAITFVACSDGNTDDDMTTTEETIVTRETTTSTSVYVPNEGDVTYREGKVKIYRNNEWRDADADVRMDNGVVVTRRGYASRDGVEIEMKDGEIVSRTGNFFDRTGQAIEDGWDATKRGVKKAGRAVGDAAEKVGDKAKEVVN